MEAAIEYYYNMDPGQIAQFTAKSQQQPSLSRGAVEQLYDRYRDQHAQDILAEGIGLRDDIFWCDSLIFSLELRNAGAHLSGMDLDFHTLLSTDT